MNLAALRNQVMAYGFNGNNPDGTALLTRITAYLNDAQDLIARRVGFYTDEAVQTITTVPGTTTYSWPADLARVRSLVDPSRTLTLMSVTLSEIDRASTVTGQPNYYALDGAGLHLYPTPDAAYSLNLRYWKTPTTLAADGDVPNLPVGWHRLLWMWAVMECYVSEDDPQTAQYWKQRFDETLSEFTADAKFPSTDSPNQVRGMWDDGSLSSRGWTLPSGY